jgi:hypothetical protein
MIDGRVRHAPAVGSSRRRLAAAALTALVALIVAVLAPAARAASGLTTGFNPDPVLTSPSAWANPFWINQAKTEGAGIVRVNLLWSTVAPAQRPSGFAADDPASPGYDWSVPDAQITALASHGANPGGVPVAEQARWYEQALYTLWRQGVDTVLLLQLVDAPPTPSYDASYESGLYYVNGQPKPAATAFRFPFVAARRGPDTVYVWGRAPAGGRLRIERRRRSTVLATVTVKPDQVFTSALRLRGPVALQAQVGSQTSLSWTT